MSNKKQKKYLKKISRKHQYKIIKTEDNPELTTEEMNIIIALTDYVKKHNGDAFYHVGFGTYNEVDRTTNVKTSGGGHPEEIEKSLKMCTKNFKRFNSK
jgi:hypothetical protein